MGTIRQAGGTTITLVQRDVPDDLLASYAQGWRDFYWTPMKAYFRRRGAPRRA